MRTKTLLLTVALAAAGVATSMAQTPVYSVNIVGYINYTMKPGFNLVANQLTNGANRITTLFENPPEESQVLKFGAGNYVGDIYVTALGGWVDATLGTPSTTTLMPGEGVFFFNANPTVDHGVTMVGEVGLGASTVALLPGFNLISGTTPMNIDLVSTNGIPAGEEDQFLTFNNTTQNYNTGLIYLSALGGWVDSLTGITNSPIIGVGQGAFYFNASLTDTIIWTRNFAP